MRPAEPRHLRNHNARMLLRLLWDERTLSRAELARRSGLARSTVSSIVQQFLDQQLVQETSSPRAGRGRPARALQLNDDRYVFLGVEMGVGHLTVVLLSLRGRIRVLVQRDHPVRVDPAGTLRALQRTIDMALAQAGVELWQVVGMGLSVPCPINPDEPDMLSPRILPRWTGTSPAAWLRARYPFRLFVQNDANLGALAEHWWGAARGHSQVTYLYLSEGVGAGHLIDGEIFGGVNGTAGEIGHTTIDPSGPLCNCGLEGCLEALVGTGQLVRRLREQLPPDDELAVSHLSLAELIAAAQRGHPQASALIQEAGRFLGIAVANLVNLMNPSLVVLGGSLITAEELLLSPTRKALAARCRWTSDSLAHVVTGSLGSEAVAIGAATRALAEALDNPGWFRPAPPPSPSLSHSSPTLESP